MRIRDKTLNRAAIVIVGILVAGWAIAPVRNARESARKSVCRSHLKQMGLALHNYHDAYGSLPPAFVNDHHGNPIHSWRLLILPFWDRHDLYSNYDFSAPWNHPANSRVAAYRTSSFFYHCPSGQSERSGMTNYVAVVGEGTAWPGRTPAAFDDISDDPAETILVIEVPDNNILWLEPQDVTVEQLLADGLGSSHSKHVSVLFADGSVGRIRKDVDAATLRSLLTIAGGEIIEEENWRPTP